METVRQFLNPLLETLGKYLPSAFGALLVFLLGLFIASLLRKGTTSLLGKLKVDERLSDKIGEDVSIEQFTSSLVYFITILWVLLLTLDVLGVKGVLDPVMNMFNNFLAIFPNIVAALLIAFVGYVISKIVASAVEVLSKGLDNLSPKLGLSKDMSLSRLLSQIIFIIVFIPVLISALDALKIEAISVPATEMLAALLIAIPKILAAGLILAIAYIVGRFITATIIELLQNLGADTLPEKISLQGFLGEKTSFSKLCGNVAFFFIMLSAMVSAVEQLAMPQLSEIFRDVLSFAGQVLVGLIILVVGNFVAGLAYIALSKSPENQGIAMIVRVSIVGLAIAMGLQAMGIADDIVNLAFGLILGSIAVTIALSFGLGGREAAGKQMEYWLEKLRK
jgi:hypothetical protein